MSDAGLDDWVFETPSRMLVDLTTPRRIGVTSACNDRSYKVSLLVVYGVVGSAAPAAAGLQTQTKAHSSYEFPKTGVTQSVTA